MSRDGYGITVRVALSTSEIIGLHGVLTLGKMFARPEDKQQVQDVLDRIGKRLKTAGVPSDAVDRLVHL